MDLALLDQTLFDITYRQYGLALLARFLDWKP